MSRGNARQVIFLSNEDRITFLKTLGHSAELHDVAILCYVLMSNHFHLVLKTHKANLSAFMKHLLVTYTVRFNKKHERWGHVFQGRFKSLIVEEDEYLLPLSRYVHLNPVRTLDQDRREPAERKKHVMEYPWSSFPGYCSLRSRVSWVEYEWLLSSYFESDDSVGRKRYRSYVYSGIDGEIENPFDDVVHQAILGGDSFVESMKGRVTNRFEREMPSLRGLKISLPVENILEKVGAAWDPG